uniref:Elongation factor 1 delta n=1 Tax=Riptortus pedestris TaxID=329032 RepID=R4WQU1_RIPPE|nr:elongation factor 1 delta [Riptortus pedestris]
MILTSPLVVEKVWLDKPKYDAAERRYYESLSKGITQNPNSWNSLAGEVAKARQHIKNSLQCIDDIAVTSNTVSVEVTNRLVSLEKENQELTSRMEKMEQRIVALEKALQAATAAAAAVASRPVEKAAPKPQPPAPKPSNDDDDDDGVDLFGSDSEEEDAEAAKIKEQRLAEYAARKAKKPVLIAKSNIILDVKPWDDETDMKLMEAEVRKIQCDGLVWGASKLVPLAYGIHKLQISCVVEDDKVSVDWLQESIEGIEDYVQSVDIAAFNKV